VTSLQRCSNIFTIWRETLGGRKHWGIWWKISQIFSAQTSTIQNQTWSKSIKQVCLLTVSIIKYSSMCLWIKDCQTPQSILKPLNLVKTIKLPWHYALSSVCCKAVIGCLIILQAIMLCAKNSLATHDQLLSYNMIYCVC